MRINIRVGKSWSFGVEARKNPEQELSNPDSFIDEVKEEVRKDRLYRHLRRYGWIGALVVVVIVGGTAYREWTTERDRVAAESLGDSIVAAQAMATPAQRIVELDNISIENSDARAIRDLIVAAAMVEGDRDTDALDRLASIAADPEVSEVYRELALLKSLAIRQGTDRPEDVLTDLERMIESNSEFRLLALEMKAHVLESMGRLDEAVAILRGLLSESSLPQDLSRRVTRLLSQLDAGS